MMIKLLTDVSCGISIDEAKSIGIEMLSLPYIIDNIEYNESILNNADFYNKLRSANTISTSQVSIGNIEIKLDSMLDTCDHIIYLPISSGLSSSYANAMPLLCDDKYKDKVTCIDHKTVSVLMRALIYDVLSMIKNGDKPEKIKNIVEENAKHNRIYISVDTLDYLKKGGRINPFVATVGNMLSLKPILFSNGGKFDVVKKARTIKQAEEMMIELVKNDLGDIFANCSKNELSFGIAFTECIDEAKSYKEKVKDELDVNTILDELPQVIGCHIGAGAVALALYKKISEY